MTTLIVDKISPKTGTGLQIGDSGDTITVPSGVTFENLGTATGFGTAGIIGVKTTSLTTSGAISGSNWQEWTGLRNEYTASSTSNRLLHLCQTSVAIDATSCVFKFYNNTTGANTNNAVAPVDSNRQGATARSHVGGTSWGLSIMFSAWSTPPNTNANQYTVMGWDHNAGGIRYNSNHDNGDSFTCDRMRAISQYTIIEFSSGVV